MSAPAGGQPDPFVAALRRRDPPPNQDPRSWEGHGFGADPAWEDLHLLFHWKFGAYTPAHVAATRANLTVDGPGCAGQVVVTAPGAMTCTACGTAAPTRRHDWFRIGWCSAPDSDPRFGCGCWACVPPGPKNQIARHRHRDPHATLRVAAARVRWDGLGRSFPDARGLAETLLGHSGPRCDGPVLVVADGWWCANSTCFWPEPRRHQARVIALAFGAYENDTDPPHWA